MRGKFFILYFLLLVIQVNFFVKLKIKKCLEILSGKREIIMGNNKLVK